MFLVYFEGMGSMGNGAAMRVAPIGAYYFDQPQKAKELAIQSAEVTHFNQEAIAGAIAIAVATTLTTQMSIENKLLSSDAFINEVGNFLPASDTKSKLNKAVSLPSTYSIETVVAALGNGTNMTSQDTVPIVLWCAAHHLNSFAEALWKAVAALGDRDTICAMVGGLTIMSSKENNIPNNWLNLVY